MNKILYIGDFDVSNENVQSSLVINNCLLLRKIGFEAILVSVNRRKTNWEVSKLNGPYGFEYYDLPYTFTINGFVKQHSIKNRIVSLIDELVCQNQIKYVFSYQSPSYASVFKGICLLFRKKGLVHIVNCADITIFSGQKLFRRIVMGLNWHFYHKYLKEYSNGLICVSEFIRGYFNYPSAKCLVLPPLFDCDSFSYLDDFEKDRETETVFLYAGTPFVINGKKAKTKGMKDRLDKIIDIFLQAEKKECKFKFYIIGLDQNQYISSVPRHGSALLASSKICFLGKLSHSITLEKIRKADFTINFRDKNVMNNAGVSTKMVESISLGTPVVLNKIGEVEKYLCNKKNAFFLEENDFDYNLDLINWLCSLTIEERGKIKKNCILENPFDYRLYVNYLNDFLQHL